MLSPVTLLVGLALSVTSVLGAARGLPWATDNKYATQFVNRPKVSWYYHWADGPVSQLSNFEFVPMFWGPKNWDKWNQRKAEMNKNMPKHVLGFNEPDLSSQSNMDPYYAASVYKQEIVPWGWKGAKIGSPAISYDLDWMGTFLSQLNKNGGYVDFVCIHWYGSYKNLAQFKTYVQTAHNRFGKNIWITEVGITTGSNPTQANVKNFMMQAMAWLDTQPYVERVAWFGAYTKAIDDFATVKNALLNSAGNSLSDMGFWYVYSNQPDRRSIAEHRRSRRDPMDGHTPAWKKSLPAEEEVM